MLELDLGIDLLLNANSDQLLRDLKESYNHSATITISSTSTTMTIQLTSSNIFTTTDCHTIQTMVSTTTTTVTIVDSVIPVH